VTSLDDLGQTTGSTRFTENAMNAETFNLTSRQFRLVDVSSQREIEQALAKALAAGEAGRRCQRR